MYILYIYAYVCGKGPAASSLEPQDQDRRQLEVSTISLKGCWACGKRCDKRCDKPHQTSSSSSKQKETI